MSNSKTVSFKGDIKQYRLNQNVKRYTLRDQGFTETKSGKFQFIRDLSTVTNSKQGILLKVVVSNDLTDLKMSTTSANGLRTVDIYNNESMRPLIEQLEYLLNNFVEQGILEVV